MAGVNYSFASGSARHVDGLLIFSESSLQKWAQPHNDTLVLTLEVRQHLMKRILVDPGSSMDLLYLPFPDSAGLQARQPTQPRKGPDRI